MKPAAAIFVLMMIAPMSEARANGRLPAEAGVFIRKFCLDCHDNAAAKAKLSLESIMADFSKPAWVGVHDRVRAREMPPPASAQPRAEERESFLEWLGKELTAAAKARQAVEGRVLLRRMNRREHETTLHDLLGIAEPLGKMLPEENALHGFDTVSRALETSATHLLRYQKVADMAIAAALPAWPVQNMVRRQTGREFLDGRPKPNREGTAPFVRFSGDTIILCAQLYKHGSVTTAHTPVTGRYRVRASVRAVQNEGKPIPVLLGRISSDRFAHERLEHLLDIQDAPADKTRIIEIEAELPAGEQVYLEGVGLTFFQELAKRLKGAPVGEDYKGPGLAVDWIELEGPLGAGLGYSRLFGDLPQVPSRHVADVLAGKPVKDDWKKWSVPGEFTKYPLTPVSLKAQDDADRLIRKFLPMAFRRPVPDERVDHFVRIAREQLAAGEPFDQSMRAAYKAVLCSPWFLSYVESPGRLDDHAVAARLARFLWNSMPDAELFATAASGRLTEPAVLRAQTERMLDDPKSSRFVRGFVDQWLDMGRFLDMKPDEIYVEFDDMLAWSMPNETYRFFREVLVRDLPTSSFVATDWTFINSRLARHYGIPGVEGLELRKASLPPDAHRGGVITQGSILKLTTNSSYTSPVKRGAWVLERIIGKPAAPPPPDVKAVEPDIRGATTIREQLDKHKNVEACASCHVHIDPPGFALENFDVVGGWRERYRVKQGGQKGTDYVELPRTPGRKAWLAKPVQADGTTVDGHRFRNIDDYRLILLKDPDQLTRNLACKLVLYSTGAEIDFADREVVERIVRDTKAQGNGFRSLIHAVIQSPVFLHK